MEAIQFYLEKVDVKDKNILYRLLQYSLFEESENDLNEMNDDGIFETDRSALIIRKPSVV